MIGKKGANRVRGQDNKESGKAGSKEKIRQKKKTD